MSTTTPLVEAAMEAQLSNLKQDVIAIKQKTAEVAKIESPEGEARAAEFCQQVKLRIKQADDARTFLVKPLNDHVRQINSTFKETTEPLEEALEEVKRGMVVWRNSESVRAAKEAAEAANLAARAAASQGDVAEFQKKAVEVKEAQVIATPKVETRTGKTTFRKVTKWEIVDPLLLPAGYWLPDEPKIAAAVKIGIEIPGVRCWTEEMPVFGS